MSDKLRGADSRKKPFLRNNIQKNDLELHYQLWPRVIYSMIYSCLFRSKSTSQILKIRYTAFPFLTPSQLCNQVLSQHWTVSIWSNSTEKFPSLREQQIHTGAFFRHISRLLAVQSLVWISQVPTGFPSWPWNYSVAPDGEAVRKNFGWQRPTLPQQYRASASDHLESETPIQL